MDQQMQDKNVSLTDACSWVLWVLAVALVVVQMASPLETAELGVIAAIGGATLTVRGYFVDLADRERNAYEIGRDSVRRAR